MGTEKSTTVKRAGKAHASSGTMETRTTSCKSFPSTSRNRFVGNKRRASFLGRRTWTYALVGEGRESGGDEGRDLALALAKAADATKAHDVRVLRVEDVVYWTRYFVLATGRSKPQMEAVAARMAQAAAEMGRNLPATPRLAEWTVLDYGDVVAHVFTPRERSYYDLEAFYSEAEVVAVPWESTAQDYT